MSVCVSSAIAAPEPLPLSARVIQQGEFPGFVPQQPMLTKSGAKVMSGLPPEFAPWKATLRRDGFRAFLTENLTSPTHAYWAAKSSVEEFRSPAAAKDAFVAWARLTSAYFRKPGRTFKRFPVNGIPGALGFHDTHPAGPFRTSSGDNIVFTDGPFLYLVGDGSATKATTTPPRSRLLAATLRLYKRVRGHHPVP
jgi:hypothetical protein